MLPRLKRLPVAEIVSLQRSRAERPTKSHLFIIKERMNGVGRNRYAVAISLRVDKRSSRRNFLRRRIHGALDKWPDSGRDVLIIGLPALSQASETEIRRELDRTGAVIFS